MKDVPKPFQSKLNPYLDEIKALRDTEPPTTYHEIARLMKERHGLDVSHHSIWHFVKVRLNTNPNTNYLQ
jgi:hypothetical protein